MGQFEAQILEFIESIVSKFSDKVSHQWIVTDDFIQLDLFTDDEWSEPELIALKFDCRKTTQVFKNLLDSLGFDQDFLISAEKPTHLIVKWFEKEYFEKREIGQE